MSHPFADPSHGKASITVSIPPAKRDAFYHALLALRQQHGDPFMSMSAIVVETVLAANENITCKERLSQDRSAR